MGLNYPRDNGKVFFIFRVLMNINGIPSPFLCFLFPVGRELMGGKLAEAESERNAALDPPHGAPRGGSDSATPVPSLPALPLLRLRAESN